MTTIVIFRWESEAGVFALFPELPNELECRGYNLEICHRATPVMHERRRSLAFCRPSLAASR
jgi:hypothetical protein